MSKNPAWNAYNETARKANEEYDSAVAPLRTKLEAELGNIKSRFAAKIDPLIIERDTLLESAKIEFEDTVKKAAKKRQETFERALATRNRELAAIATEKKTASASA